MLWLLAAVQLLVLSVLAAVGYALWCIRDPFWSACHHLFRDASNLIERLNCVTARWESIAEETRKDRMASSNYVAGTVTLTNASQVYNLLNLIHAQVDANCPGAARSLNIYAAHANSAQVFVGSGNVSGTNYGYVLNSDDMRGYDSTYQNVLVGDISVFSLAPGMQLGIEVMAM